MNRQVLLAARPEGPVKPEHFRIADAPMPVPQEGEVLVRSRYLSLDPYMRGRMIAARSYVKPVEIGDVMVGEAAGEVVESRSDRFQAGDTVVAPVGWQCYAALPAAMITKVDAARAPLSYYLGALGMPGRTAWFGLREVGQPKPGETVVVSAASGAVGSVVGQLAKSMGCRAVGIAGGREKCAYVVDELGFDACVDYKAGRLYEDLRAACPKGIDVQFENVGGEVLDTSLRLMNTFARIVLCGTIADYDAAAPYPIRNLRSVLVNRIRMQGIIVFDWQSRYAEAQAGLLELYGQGRLKTRETIAEGLDAAPAAFIALLHGGNFGKQLVRLA